LEIDRRDSATKPLEQARHERTTRATHTIECHMKLATTNPINVDERQRHDHVLMPRHCAEIRLDFSKLIPGHPWNFSIHDRAHLCAFCTIEKQSRWTDELERVPLDRIMTRSYCESSRGMMVLDRELNRRRRRHSDIDHVASNRLQRTDHRPVKHRAGYATVAPNDDFLRIALGTSPRPKTCGEFRDDLRRQT